MAFFNEVTSFNRNASDESLAGLLKPVGTALGHLQQATMSFMQNALARPDHAGAGATDYMHMFGLVALAYMWVRIAKAAQAKLKAGADGEAARMEGKLATAKFSCSGCCLRRKRISAIGFFFVHVTFFD